MKNQYTWPIESKTCYGSTFLLHLTSFSILPHFKNQEPILNLNFLEYKNIVKKKMERKKSKNEEDSTGNQREASLISQQDFENIEDQDDDKSDFLGFHTNIEHFQI